jgi:hypothetical protein
MAEQKTETKTRRKMLFCCPNVVKKIDKICPTYYVVKKIGVRIPYAPPWKKKPRNFCFLGFSLFFSVFLVCCAEKTGEERF